MTSHLYYSGLSILKFSFILNLKRTTMFLSLNNLDILFSYSGLNSPSYTPT